MNRFDKIKSVWSKILANTIYHPFVLMLICLISLFSILYFNDFATKYEFFDAEVLLFIASVFTLATVFMVLSTRWTGWTYLAAGLVATFFADATLYTVIGGRAFGLPVPYPDVALYVARASFLVGGLWVLIGLSSEWWNREMEDTNSLVYRALRNPMHAWRNRRNRDNV